MNAPLLFGQPKSAWSVFLLRTAIDKLARKNYNIGRARPGESKQALYFRLEALQRELTQEQLASIIAEFQACQYETAEVCCAPQQECNLQGQQQKPPPQNAEIAGARDGEAQDNDSRDRILRLELVFEDSRNQALMLGTHIEHLVNHIAELEARYNESQNLVAELRMQSDSSENRITELEVQNNDSQTSVAELRTQVTELRNRNAELEANVTRQNARLARRVVRRRILSNGERVRLRRANRRLRRRGQRLLEAVQDVHGLADGWRWI